MVESRISVEWFAFEDRASSKKYDRYDSYNEMFQRGFYGYDSNLSDGMPHSWYS